MKYFVHNYLHETLDKLIKYNCVKMYQIANTGTFIIMLNICRCTTNSMVDNIFKNIRAYDLLSNVALIII
jgi:hypothetical protein